MTTIWKYTLAITDEQIFEVPESSKVVHVGLDPSGKPCIWLKVQTEAPAGQLVISIRSTGQPVPDDLPYVGCILQPPFVWHVFATVLEYT